MSESTDRILDLIDAGLAELPAPVYGRSGVCGRCSRPADGEFCSGCRWFLLGDSDVDPKAALTLSDVKDVTAHSGRPGRVFEHTVTVSVDFDEATVMQAVEALAAQVERDILAERVRQRAGWNVGRRLSGWFNASN